jgi:hypothetical protein
MQRGILLPLLWAGRSGGTPGRPGL